MVDVEGKEAFGLLIARRLADMRDEIRSFEGRVSPCSDPYQAAELSRVEDRMRELAAAIKRYRAAAG